MSLLSLPTKDEFSTSIRNTKAYLVFINPRSTNYPNHYTIIKTDNEAKLSKMLDCHLGKDAWLPPICLGESNSYSVDCLQQLAHQLTILDEKSRQFVKIWDQKEKPSLSNNPIQLPGLDKPRFNYDQIKMRYVSNYKVNIPWTYLEEQLENYKEHWNLDLDPEFQRAHVWDTEKQRRYIEFRLSGGLTAREIYFNCPGWDHKLANVTMTLIDGKQRIQAVNLFLKDELKIFGGYKKSEILGRYDSQCDFIFYVNDLSSRAAEIEWYIQINDGGIAHTPEEIEKARRLFEIEIQKHEKLD